MVNMESKVKRLYLRLRGRRSGAPVIREVVKYALHRKWITFEVAAKLWVRTETSGKNQRALKLVSGGGEGANREKVE
jgi:hypothetical protein